MNICEMVARNARMYPNDTAPILNFAAGKACGVNIGWVSVPVPRPILMVDKPHNHDFDQFLCFFGTNPMNIEDFGAEIELSLGGEGEKHIITTPTIVPSTISESINLFSIWIFTLHPNT